jgi:hypothetical protein
MKGSNTADAIKLVVITCCVRVVGCGARAENWRIAECVKLDRTTVASAILTRIFEGTCVVQDDSKTARKPRSAGKVR